MLWFGLASAAVLCAMGWVTAHTLRLEKREAAAVAEAKYQETVRLVLWRMDSALTPIIAREAARPYFEYLPFYPADSAFPAAKASSALEPDDKQEISEPGSSFDATNSAQPASLRRVLVPSPLLSPDLNFANVYFQRNWEGVLTSPQTPTGAAETLARGTFTTDYDLLVANDRLNRLDIMLRSQENVTTASTQHPGINTTTADASTLGLGSGTNPATPPLADIVSKPGNKTIIGTPHRTVQHNTTQETLSNAANSVTNRAPGAIADPSSPSAPPASANDLHSPLASVLEQQSVGQNITEPTTQSRPSGVSGEQSKSKSVDSDQQNYGEYQARQQATSAAAQNDPSRLRNNRSIPQSDQVSKENASENRTKQVSAPPSGNAGPATEAHEHLKKYSSPASNSELERPTTSTVATKISERGEPSPQSPAVTTAPAGAASLQAATSEKKYQTQLHLDPQSVTIPDVSGDSTAGIDSVASDIAPGLGSEISTARDNVEQGQFSARWVREPGSSEPELMFERRVRIAEREYTQGIWLNWPALKSMLLRTSAELLPNADLVPVLNINQIEYDQSALGRTLAAIPVQLTTQPFDTTAITSGWTTVKTTLSVMWFSVLGAIAIAGFALWASLELAQRRGKFVSAVTHELRTPLTTFCLYSQMLADGMIRDEDAKRNYLTTLKAESMRLARIVESVLDYARLSGKPPVVQRREITIADFMLASRRPLAARCEQAGTELIFTGDALSEERILTDSSLVERILFNLVDNACKYAHSSQNKTIELGAIIKDKQVTFTVRDYGPGLPENELRSLFKAFTRGENHAGGSIPGLGLGLAISRSLAEQLGGTLNAQNADPGAMFILQLPQT